MCKKNYCKRSEWVSYAAGTNNNCTTLSNIFFTQMNFVRSKGEINKEIMGKLHISYLQTTMRKFSLEIEYIFVQGTGKNN